ncbi:MAG: DUF456 domain-containing protein [Anaerolineae bacterium]
MSETLSEIIKLVAYIGLMLGLVGTVAPVLPGPPIVWLSAVLWAWADGFDRVGWPTLLIMAILMILASIIDIVLSTWFGKRTGASWKSLAIAGVAAVAGFLAFSLPGALVGAAVGVFAAETLRLGGDVRGALRTSSGVAIGYVAALAAQLVLVLAMLLVFTVQAFGPG